MKIPHKELSSAQRGEIVGAYRFGTRAATIARTLGFPPSTVYDTINRYKQTGSVQSKPRPGRPKSLNDRDQRVVKRVVLAGRRKTLGEITNEVNARLNMTLCTEHRPKIHGRNGVFQSCSLQEAAFEKKNVKARLEWCKERRAWDEEWKKVVFSDESRFCLFHNDGRAGVWRGVGERYNVDCLKPTVQGGGGSVMMWGCISWEGVGPLVLVEGTLDQYRYVNLLSKHLVPYLKEIDEQHPGVIFQRRQCALPHC